MGLFQELKDTITTAFQQSQSFRAAVTMAGLTAGVGLWTVYAPTARRDFRSPAFDQPGAQIAETLIAKGRLDEDIAEMYIYGKVMRHLMYERGDPAEYAQLAEKVRAQLKEADSYIFWNRVNDMGQLPYTEPARWLDKKAGTDLHGRLHSYRPRMDISTANEQTEYERLFQRVLELLAQGKTFPDDPYIPFKEREKLSPEEKERYDIALKVVELTRPAEMRVKLLEVLNDPQVRITTDEPIVERLVAGPASFDRFYYDLDRIYFKAEQRQDVEQMERIKEIYKKELVLENSKGQTLRLSYTDLAETNFGMRLAHLVHQLLEGRRVEITGEYADGVLPPSPSAPPPPSNPGRGR